MKALIIVDVQNDFCPGGALAVNEGGRVVPVINKIQLESGFDFDLIVATQDWHPVDHGSFAASHPGKHPGEFIDLNGLEQILWPVHCVQDSVGAEFHADLHLEKLDDIFRKGEDKGIDSYSGFFDNGHKKSTGLGDYLKEKGVTDVYICGLATDYCVKFTVLDAIDLGFNTYVIEDACRGVELNPGDTEKAITEMKTKGASIIISEDL